MYEERKRRLVCLIYMCHTRAAHVIKQLPVLSCTVSIVAPTHVHTLEKNEGSEAHCMQAHIICISA